MRGDTRAAERRSTPTVSVLLPAWNEAAMIGQCLDSLLTVDWPDLEIVVCAGGTDETLEWAQRYASDRVLVLEQRPGGGKQRALRRCFEHSSGEIIYLTDADCIVSPATFSAVIAPIVRGEVAAATGTSRPADEQMTEPFPFYQWSILRAVERKRGDISNGLLGRNCAVRRDALLDAGAFDDPVPIGTDYHLAKSLLATGHQIRFVPAAVKTPYPVRPRAFARQQSRWLRNIFLHGSRFDDRAELVASARTVAIGASFLLWPLSWPWTRRIGIAVWLAFFAELVERRIRYGRALSAETGIALPHGYVARLPWLTLLDIASWTGPIVDAASRGRRLKW